MIEHFKDKLKELTELSKEDIGYNENNVKFHFIIPLLECFGHNRFDFEHPSQTNRIDIFIKQSDKHSSCGFVIEAKNYDKNLDEYLIQLQKYSDFKRPLLAIISNGEEIRFYDPSWRGVPFSESLLYSIKRIDLNNDEIIARLEKLFSKENLNNELLHDYIDEREKEIKDVKREIESLTKEYKNKEEKISNERKILEEDIKKLKEKYILPIIVPSKKVIITPDIVDSEVIEIFANYIRQLYKATYYSPDKIVYNGKEYTSPSAAGTAVTNKPCNGWVFWKFKDETGKEHLLDKLRPKIVPSVIDKKERDIPESQERPTSDRDITQDSKSRRIFANYRKQLYEATYYSRDKIVYNGKEYTSPSAAGTAVTNKPCNGWVFWKFKDETGKEQLLDKLR
ncbi:MAG: hypothetical protein WC556_13705 [Candidatus Methanoperedens sp.]